MRIKLKNLLFEGGESAGSLELLSTDIEEARKFAKKKGFNLDKELPNFNDNYKLAQKKIKIGRTKRKNMPVIDDKDVKKFQKRLEQGTLDIYKPFAKQTVAEDPFPTGLSGLDAKNFITNGLKDGSKKDDIVAVKIKKISVKKLKPIQKQIYYDKSMGATIQSGISRTTNFLENISFFIISKDNFIIDGHHRFLSALLVDPDMKINALSIDLPIKKLLPLSLSYGDAIGNKRNA